MAPPASKGASLKKDSASDPRPIVESESLDVEINARCIQVILPVRWRRFCCRPGALWEVLVHSSTFIRDYRLMTRDSIQSMEYIASNLYLLGQL
jgi:hypothetical protein